MVTRILVGSSGRSTRMLQNTKTYRHMVCENSSSDTYTTTEHRNIASITNFLRHVRYLLPWRSCICAHKKRTDRFKQEMEVTVVDVHGTETTDYVQLFGRS